MTDVVRVVTRLNIGGPARHALILTRSLPAHGFPSALVVGTPTEEEGELTDPHVPVTRLPNLQREISPARDISSLRSLGRILEERRPAIVHTHMAKAGALGRLAAHRAGVPHVFHTYHGHVLEGYFSDARSAFYLSLERWLARRTELLVAVSEAIRDQLFDLGIGEAPQWRVVPLGLDLEPLLTSDVDASAARSALGLSTAGPVVAIVGRLVPIKDHALFLESAVRVAEAFPDATFLVAGDGELRLELEARARRMLGGRVHFAGWVEDLASLYAASDVVVLSSRNEGTPVALIEASAAGVPVVATDVGGVADVVLQERTGRIVPPGDAASLADAVICLLNDPGLRARMGASGRHHVSQRFSSGRLVTDIVSLYEEALERRSYSS
jgi:glycosyltransferase involved in cell wall biosynthesis